MTDVSSPPPRSAVSTRTVLFSGLRNFARYAVRRLLAITVTVIFAVYLTILIANYGGYVDEIIRARIDLQIAGMVMGGWLQDVPTEEKFAIIEETTAAMQAAEGLNDPFLLRTARWLSDGLTLNWGEVRRPQIYGSANNVREVRQIINANLARTLLVFGTANILLFFTTISLALVMARHYGSRLDRALAALSPLSAAPAWVYGVLLNIILLRLFAFSTRGTLDNLPSSLNLAAVAILVRHLFPVFVAIFISGLFQGIYAWRTYFLLYSSEDYVEMARAKGLSPGMVDRRYILRPALPGLLTSLALLAMSLWQEIIALEFFFNVAGIGRLLMAALRALDTPMIVGLVVTFAYLLAITVFLLDVLYALTDPRVRIGGAESGAVATARVVAGRRTWPWAKVRRPRLGRGAAGETAVIPLPRPRQRPRLAWPDPARLLRQLGRLFSRSAGVVRQLARYPSAVFGLVTILALIIVAVYAVVTIPRERAIALWRGDGNVWARNPRTALPVWVNYFRVEPLPETQILDSRQPGIDKRTTALTDEFTEIVITMPYDFDYGGFPQDMVVYYTAVFAQKQPHVDLAWLTPDGREIRISSSSVRRTESYHFSQDARLQRRLDTSFPQRALFADPGQPGLTPLQGRYTLQINALVFEEGSDLDAEWVIYGRVHGLAGTDANRRDLMVALLWGTPVALAFGLLAALGTSVSGMLFAALGAWFGGWVDRLVQFLTETSLILPFFPVSLMIFTLYSKSIWVILGVTIVLSIFGSAIKTYRAVFLQVKEMPYIEAAQTYGASDWRIVGRYLIPRIVSVLIPQLIILVPSYVFLEATLAFLGVSDPVLPTWGKLIVAALSEGVQQEAYHLVFIPLSLLLLTGFAFAMVGLALERVFEPRLRET